MTSRLILTALVGAAALAAPGVASAASQAVVSDLPIASQSTALGEYHVVATDPLTIMSIDAKVKPKVTWTGKLSTLLGWESANVRQGASLKVTRNTPFQSGSMKVTWDIDGTIRLRDINLVYTPDLTTSTTVGCLPMTYGDKYDCLATSDPLTVVRTPGMPASPYVKIVLRARFTVTPEGVLVNRTWSIPDGNDSGATAWALPLSLTGASETLKVPCDSPAGLPYSYKLGGLSYTPTVAATQQAYVQVGFADPVLGAAELPALYDGPLGTPYKSNPEFKLNGSGATWNLGNLLANTSAPTLGTMSFIGKAGSPVVFSAEVNSRCDIASYEWKFSNGTTSYGPSPLRTFNASGDYDGQLTVTDITGLKATKGFTVAITK